MRSSSSPPPQNDSEDGAAGKGDMLRGEGRDECCEKGRWILQEKVTWMFADGKRCVPKTRNMSAAMVMTGEKRCLQCDSEDCFRSAYVNIVSKAMASGGQMFPEETKSSISGWGRMGRPLRGQCRIPVTMVKTLPSQISDGVYQQICSGVSLAVSIDLSHSWESQHQLLSLW